MHALITGGAGFIGSHLSEALLDSGHEVLDPRQPVDRLDRQHRASQGPAGLRVLHRHGQQRAAARRADRSQRRRLPFRRRRRRQADRRAAGPHDRDQRARHRGRAEAREQEEEARRHRVDLRGVRQERGRAVPRGLGPRAGPDAQAPLGVRVQQGDRRVPGAGVLEGAQAAGHHRALLQHGRPAPDRAVRHGDPELRAAGARRRADHGVRRRHAVARRSRTSPTSSARC